MCLAPACMEKHTSLPDGWTPGMVDFAGSGSTRDSSHAQNCTHMSRPPKPLGGKGDSEKGRAGG